MNYSGKILNWTHINSTIASRLNIPIAGKEKRGRKKGKEEVLKTQEAYLSLDVLKVLIFKRPLSRVIYIVNIGGKETLG